MGGRRNEQARRAHHDPEGGAKALLLLVGTPEDVLERIVPGDPLGLARAVARELRGRAYLLDAGQVLRRTFARCARSATSWRGTPALEDWLLLRVREAIADVLREEERVARDSRRDPPNDALGWIARPLGLRGGPLRGACARFNALDVHLREAFFRVLLEGRPLEAFALEAQIAVTEAGRRARRGLEIFREAVAAPEDGASAAGAERRAS